MAAAWYVLQSKARKEDVLCMQLSLQNLDSYCPMIPAHAVNPRARQTLPYFPGYVFAKVDLERFQLSMLRWLPGAVSIVCFDRVPASVSEDLLTAIRLRVDDLGRTHDEPRCAGLKKGDPVKIQHGPFAGYTAIFDAHIAGSERARVLLLYLQGKQLPVELPTDCI